MNFYLTKKMLKAFLLLLLILVASCVNHEKDKRCNYLILKNSSELKIKIYDANFNLIKSDTEVKENLQTFKINRSSDGFSFMYVDSDRGGYMFYESLYTRRGDSLVVSIDKKKKVSLSGNKNIVNLNNSIHELNEILFPENYDNETRFKLEPNRFKQLMDSVYNNREKELVSFGENYNISNKLNSFLKNKINNFRSVECLEYLTYHNYYSKGVFSYLNPDTISFNVDSLIKKAKKHKFTQKHNQLISLLLDFKFNKQYSDQIDSIKYQNIFEKKWNIIKNNFHGDDQIIAAKGLMKQLHINLPFKKRFYENFKGALNEVKIKVDSTNKEFFVSNFYHYFNKVRKILPGEPAPNFKFRNEKDEEVSLSDFEGKYVYLTFWATWCGPCIESLPKYKEAMVKYKNVNDIEFVFIALEYDTKNIEEWKKFIQKNNFTGVQLVAEKQFMNDYVKSLMVQAIPRFMILGKGGEIINPNALAPYDNEREISNLLLSHE